MFYFRFSNPSVPTHPLCWSHSSPSPTAMEAKICVGGVVVACAIRTISWKTWIHFWMSLRVLNAWHCSPSGNIISGAGKGEKEPWCSGFRPWRQEWRQGGLFQGECNLGSGMMAEALCMGFDLVLLLHVCALPVCREQWQYSLKFPFLIWLRVSFPILWILL